MRYFYESHLGGIFSSEYELDWDDLYCDQCNDTDMLYAVIKTGGDLLWFINNLHEDGYSDEYICEILDEYYPDIDVYLPPFSPFKGNLEDYYYNKGVEMEILEDEYNEDERYLREMICGNDCIYAGEEFIPECCDCVNTYEYALYTGNPRELKTKILS